MEKDSEELLSNPVLPNHLPSMAYTQETSTQKNVKNLNNFVNMENIPKK